MKNIVKALLCFTLLFSVGSMAQQAPTTTNSIYMDQIGDSSTITLTQKGAGNSMGTETSPLTLTGNSQLLNFTQEGNNNSLQGRIISSSVTSTINNIGNNNTIDLDMGSAASVSGTNLNLALTGASNLFTLTQGNTASSTGSTLNYTVTGDFNTLTSTINSNGVNNTMSVTGDQNVISTTQNGYDLSLIHI